MQLKKFLYLAGLSLISLPYYSNAQSGPNPARHNKKTPSELATGGNFKGAAIAIDKLGAGRAEKDKEVLYNYARTYAQAGEKTKALKLLNQAIDRGFLAINRVKEDDALKTALGSSGMEQVLSRMRQLSAPYISGKAVLSKAEKEEIFKLALAGLDKFYFDPKVGKEMTDDLNRMFYKEGHFDQIDTLSKFTGELVKYFRKKTNDKHFYIGVDRGQVSERVPNLSVTTPEERNFGFREVAVRNGNIGYIRWDECIAGPEAYKTAESALNLMRNTRAVVIDISRNGGGNGEISTFLYHYLFKPEDKRFETLLIKKCKGEDEWRRSEPPVAPLSASPNLGDKPIYVVISGNTFSAAEYFAFMMKELDRATIIGKNTGGGGNPVNMIRNGRYMMYVPTCQITTNEGKSLEGKGVAPDIEFKTEDWSKELMEVVNDDLKKQGK